jgi:hypothetical protein
MTFELPMPDELSIHQAEPLLENPDDDAPRDNAAEQHRRSLVLALRLARSLESAETHSLPPEARHELLLARSLSLHIVDILSNQTFA